MKKAAIAGMVVLCLFHTTFSWAASRTFYLKNGEQIEYLSYRQKGDRIFLLINKYTEIDFPAREVDFRKMRKTVAGKKHKKPVPVVAAVTASPASNKP